MRMIVIIAIMVVNIGIAYAYIDGVGYVKNDDKPVPLHTIKPLITVKGK